MWIHAIRITGSMIAFAIGTHVGAWAMVIASAAIFLAAFAMFHDLAHRAFPIPRPLGELALSLAGALMLASGHGMRVMHLRHHARLLADDDYEGASAKLSFVRAAIASPTLSIAMRIEAIRSANGDKKRRQIAEAAFNVLSAFALSLALGRAGAIYAATSIALQLSMPLWAGHVPHRAPPWIIALARRLAFTRSVVLLSLAYHELHHAHPRVPTAALAGVARAGTT